MSCWMVFGVIRNQEIKSLILDQVLETVTIFEFIYDQYAYPGQYNLYTAGGASRTIPTLVVPKILLLMVKILYS